MTNQECSTTAPAVDGIAMSEAYRRQAYASLTGAHPDDPTFEAGYIAYRDAERERWAAMTGPLPSLPPSPAAAVAAELTPATDDGSDGPAPKGSGDGNFASSSIRYTPAPIIKVGDWSAPDLSEPGVAAMFVEAAKDRHLYLVDSSPPCWMAWSGKVWKPDVGESRHLFLQSVLNDLLYVAAKAPGEWQGKIAKFVAATHPHHRRESIIRTARSIPEIQARREDFDRNPDLLNCQNGTVDLRKCSLRPHEPKDRLSKIAPIPFFTNTAAQRWARFLTEIQPDREIRMFLQRFAGYSATGHTREHALAFLHGDGANGKSSFLHAIMSALGPAYADYAAPGLLMAANEKADFEMEDLRGKRMMVSTETGQGQALSEERVKRLASSDPVKGRAIYRGFDTAFAPTHKLWIDSNHEPRVHGQDEGIWRRIHRVPFNVTYRSHGDTDPSRQNLPIMDPGLGDELRRELPGILAWIVQGAALWYATGLNPPASVRKATAEYRSSQDLLALWIEEAPAVVLAKRGVGVELADVRREVCSAAVAAGERPPYHHALSSGLKRAGLRVERGTGGRRRVVPVDPVTSSMAVPAARC